MANITPFSADEAVSRENFNNRIAETALALATKLQADKAITMTNSQDLAIKQVRNATISPLDVSGGSNGDLWFKYS